MYIIMIIIIECIYRYDVVCTCIYNILHHIISSKFLYDMVQFQKEYYCHKDDDDDDVDVT